MMATHSILKIWRKAKVIAVEKPGKDQSLAANSNLTAEYVLQVGLCESSFLQLEYSTEYLIEYLMDTGSY